MWTRLKATPTGHDWVSRLNRVELLRACLFKAWFHSYHCIASIALARSGSIPFPLQTCPSVPDEAQHVQTHTKHSVRQVKQKITDTRRTSAGSNSFNEMNNENIKNLVSLVEHLTPLTPERSNDHNGMAMALDTNPRQTHSKCYFKMTNWIFTLTQEMMIWTKVELLKILTYQQKMFISYHNLGLPVHSHGTQHIRIMKW